MNTMTHQELGAALAQASSDIKWAEAGKRSVSTMNRLWRKYFQIEDALKFFRGGW